MLGSEGLLMMGSAYRKLVRSEVCFLLGKQQLSRLIRVFHVNPDSLPNSWLWRRWAVNIPPEMVPTLYIIWFLLFTCLNT